MISMEYKLARELKDAGFPQVTPNGRLITLGANHPSVNKPTLEELIEACKEVNLTVHRRGGEKKCFASVHKEGFYEVYFSGETPTEAVAKLWLALNK